MSIAGKSLGEVCRTHRDQINALLHATITPQPITLHIVSATNLANLRFRGYAGEDTALITTQYGPMSLYIGQLCTSELDENRVHLLRTVQYRYAITPEGLSQPALRWEYVRDPDGEVAFWARSHLQGPVPVDLGSQFVSMNDLHIPTGNVLVEEIIRFCINDLGVTPLSPGWDAILRESSSAE